MLSLSLLSPTTKMVSPRLLLPPAPPLVIFRWRKFQPFSLKYRFTCQFFFFKGNKEKGMSESISNHLSGLTWKWLVCLFPSSSCPPSGFCLLILSSLECFRVYFGSSIFNIYLLYIVYCVGLNIEVDRILEIACIITDGQLTKSVEVYIYVLLSISYLVEIA